MNIEIEDNAGIKEMEGGGIDIPPLNT